MRNAYIVVGANYGDEGKGLVTDYLCKRHRPLYVIKFNGGAQAGHTVQLSNKNTRFVFSQLSSGSFRGVPTFLSHYFVVNPITFLKEFNRLEKMIGIILIPQVIVSPDCLITTPYDILLNQIAEKYRGEGKHGSCGMGINETIERSKYSNFLLRTWDLSPTKIEKTLLEIKYEYFFRRIRESCDTGIDRKYLKEYMPEEYKIWESQNVIENFVNKCQAFLSLIKIRDDEALMKTIKPNDNIVFEGAQGLQLDKDFGEFPYVTRSNTNSTNVVNLLQHTDIEQVNNIYVTRTYVTRHGAGPLTYELRIPPYLNVLDETNIDNPWQGKLRYKYLDVDQMLNAIDYDQRIIKRLGGITNTAFNKHLFITCLDHVGSESIQRTYNRVIKPVNIDDFVNSFSGSFSKIYTSDGPTATDVKEI